MGNIWAPSDILVHHGILGMKWGKKNGPPYPLGASDHSVSEKKAGWRKSLDKKDPPLKRALKKTIKNDVEKQRKIRESVAKDQKLKVDINSKLDTHANEINKLITMGDEVIDKANLVNKNLEKELSSVKMDEHTKELIWTALEKDFGGKDQIDDAELFEWVVNEYVDAALLSHIYERQDVKDYLKYQDEYWARVESFADSIVEDYKDVPVNNQIVNQTARNIVYDRAGTRFMAYLYKHFDDYWVRDTEAYSNAVERLAKDFTLDKWNKR